MCAYEQSPPNEKELTSERIRALGAQAAAYRKLAEGLEREMRCLQRHLLANIDTSDQNRYSTVANT